MCKSPILLTNPNVLKLWRKADYYVVDGNICDYISFNKMKHLCGYSKQFKNSFEVESDPEKIDYIVNNNYIVVNGIRINAFISAPCRRCDVCLNSRRLETEARCLFEAADLPNLYFFTLTYSDLWLGDGNLDSRLVSGFLKRFRENLAYAYSKKFNVSLSDAREQTFFRCVYVGEYGKLTQRPHYHGIFFFKNSLHPRYDSWLYEVFAKSWEYGYILDLQRVKNPAASARYICKYLTKQSFYNAPEGKTPCFIRTPRKCGLGCYKLGTHLEDIINSKDNTIKLRIGSQLVKVRIPKFILEKVFPSFSRLYGSLADGFYVLDQVRAEMRYRVENDPFTHCFNTEKFDDIISSSDYLRQGLKSRCSVKFQSYMEEYTHIPYSDPYCSLLYFGSYTDEELNNEFNNLLEWIQGLPSEDEFFSIISKKLRWQNNLVIPERSYKEKVAFSEKNIFSNENYVRKKMLNENFDLSLQL